MSVHPHNIIVKPAYKAELAITIVEEREKDGSLISSVRIHNQTMSAIANFHELYVQSQSGREETASQGHQDILRAMLLFACSGLDAVVKQLIEDTLETVLKHDAGAQQQFRTFVERRLKKSSGSDDRERGVSNAVLLDIGFIADLFVSFDPRSKLIGALISSLRADSLQSRDQLLRVAAHFALTKDDVMADDRATKEAFDARNQITHEMDINLSSGNDRRERKYETMVRWCENIAEISRRFIGQTEVKMHATPLGDEDGN